MRSPLRWLFVGQGPMGAAALEAMTARHRPAAVLTTEPALAAQPVGSTASVHGLALHHVDGIGDDPAARWPDLFTSLDVVVCCCWAERLRPAALQAPTHGWLNLHPSRLPAWRGADPVAWQLLARPARIGCTVHRMTQRHDAGPVVEQGSVPVAAGDDRGTLLHRSGTRLGELACDVLDVLAGRAELRERPQEAEEATWCPPPGTTAIVDPRVTRGAAAAQIARAFSPEPGIAVATLGADQRFALTAVGDELGGADTPGTVVRHDDGTVAVACWDRWLHGRRWSVDADAPARADLSAPGETRLPRG